MARVKTKTRPQAYPAMSFHLVRAIAFISQAVVSGILIYFCIQLKNDGFKLPWTFLIVLAASLLSIVTLIITSLFYLCAFLSPLFNLIVNVTILIIQFVGFVLLSQNMFGTLGRSCSSSNWANADGLNVCRIYKAFYAFAVFAVLAQIAQIVLDARSRHKQTKLGRYGNIEDSRDHKLDSLIKQGHSHQPSHASSVDSVPYGIPDYHDQQRRQTQEQSARPTYQAYQPYQGESTSYYSNNPSQTRGDYGGYGSQQSHMYGSGGYGYSGR